jgi:Tol biopolymer transport system component
MRRNPAVRALTTLVLLLNTAQAREDTTDSRRPASVPILAQGAGDEPELVITPNSIRIQSFASPDRGRWIVMPGYSELGSPCFSRDGDWIAFDAYKQGYNNSQAECWVARSDGRDLARLTFGSTPRWSPDGKLLLFKRERVNDVNRAGEIFLINRDGSGERRIGEGRWPDWSPDGKEIVFSLGGEPTGGARIGATIWIARVDGSDPRVLAEGDCPSWSPDGKKIAFCYRAPDRSPQILIHDLETHEEKALGVGWFRANWTSESKSVVANGEIGGESTMVQLSAVGPRSQTELPTGFEEPFSPCCSWDGKDIVYIARRPGKKRP